MPSKTDFNQPAKMSYQAVQTSNADGGFSVFRKNFYRRAITVNNTGKTAKTNYYVAVIFDTFQTYIDFKIDLNFNSLRVYDSDETTRLEHYVQTAGSEQTVVFVKIPSLSASSKTIYFEYGNTGLPSLNNQINKPPRSQDFWNFNKQSFKDWFVGHNARRFFEQYNPFEFNAVQTWSNLRNSTNFGFFPSSDVPAFSMPRLNGHTGFGTDVKINNLNTVFFNGNSRMQLEASTGSFKPVNNANNSYFAIALRTGTLSSSIRSIIGSQTNGISITLSATQQLRITQTGITNYIISSTTLANNTNYILECWLRPTTGSGFSATVRINNVSQTATGTHASFPNSLSHFSTLGGNPSSGYAEVYISEILYFNGANTTSTEDTNLRNDVYNYLNTKYRIVGSADMPTITVGAETTITNNIQDNYVSYNSLSKFSSQSELQNGFFGTESNKTQVDIKKILEKPFLSGRTVFTNSTLSLDNKITEKASRQYTSNTTSNYAVSSDFSLILSSENYTNLGKFQYKDIIENTDYLSDDFDYISFEVNIPDTSLINKTDCRLEFSNTSGFASNYNINFTSQELENGLSVLFFKKSSFAKVGTINWGDVKFCRVRIRNTSGSQVVNFGNFKLIRNYDEVLKTGDKILLGQAVSLDQNNTFYKDNINLNYVDQVFNSEKDITVKSKNVLDKFLDSRLDELPGWLDDGRQFFSNYFRNLDTSLDLYKNYSLKRIFNLAFPYQILDFQSLPDFDIPIDIFWRGEYKIRDYLEPVLNLTGGSVYFDGESQKIKYTTGFQKFDSTSLTLENEIYIKESEILEFSENTSNSHQIYNSVTIPSFYTPQAILDNQNVFSYLPLSDLPAPIRIEGASTQEVFINLEEFENTRGDFTVYLDNLRLSNALLSETEDGVLLPAFDLNVEYRNLRFLPPSTAVFTVQNNSFAPRFLRKVAFNAMYIVYYSSLPNFFEVSPETLTFNYENSESVKKFGRNPVNFDNLLLNNQLYSDTENDKLKGFWQRTIDKFNGLNNFKEIELVINNNPEIILNTRVRLKNKQGVIIKGIVNKVDVNKANKKTITVYLTS
jgi:hypothetical protein